MAGIVTTVLPIVTNVLDRLIPDKAEAARIQAELEAELVKSANAIQIETIRTNQLDAQGSGVLQRSWRPMIGIACAASIMWIFIGYPFTSWILQLFGLPVPVSNLPTDLVLELTLAMLGMSGLRTFEKLRNVA